MSVNSAPIGAQVFAIERRNHSKTGVYEDLCMRVPVDTTFAIDKLKKAEKGFKFARFDVSFQPIGSLLYRQGSKDRLERRSARMGGLPFESVPPSLRLPSRLCDLQIASGAAFSGLEAPLDRHTPKSIAECPTLRIPNSFESLPSWIEKPVRGCASKYGTLQQKDRFQSPRVGIERFRCPPFQQKADTISGQAPNQPNQVRHSACIMGWVRVGMTARLRKNLRSETTRRRCNERT